MSKIAEDKKAKVNVAPEETPAWEFPFSQLQVEKWKNEYGKFRIHLVKGLEDDLFVIRALGRKEFQEMAKEPFKNEDDMENLFVTNVLLFPDLSLSELRVKPASFIPMLFEKLMESSNVSTTRETATKEFVAEQDKLPQEVKDLMKDSDIKPSDISQWFGLHKKLYYEIYEGRLFIYHGLRRSDFEKHKEGQRKGEHSGAASEEHLVSRGVIYPFGMEPASDEYLHGTITKLSNLVYAASGYNSVVTSQIL